MTPPLSSSYSSPRNPVSVSSEQEQGSAEKSLVKRISLSRSLHVFSIQVTLVYDAITCLSDSLVLDDWFPRTDFCVLARTPVWESECARTLNLGWWISEIREWRMHWIAGTWHPPLVMPLRHSASELMKMLLTMQQTKPNSATYLPNKAVSSLFGVTQSYTRYVVLTHKFGGCHSLLFPRRECINRARLQKVSC